MSFCTYNIHDLLDEGGPEKNMDYLASLNARSIRKSSISSPAMPLILRAFEVLLDIQRKIGGGVIFVECERQKKLLDFYQNEHNRFVVFGEREDHAAGKEYVQLLKVI